MVVQGVPGDDLALLGAPGDDLALLGAPGLKFKISIYIVKMLLPQSKHPPTMYHQTFLVFKVSAVSAILSLSHSCRLPGVAKFINSHDIGHV